MKNIRIIEVLHGRGVMHTVHLAVSINERNNCKEEEEEEEAKRKWWVVNFLVFAGTQYLFSASSKTIQYLQSHQLQLQTPRLHK
jgi:hypothetical protein